MTKLGFITFDEKLEAAWGLHKIEKAVFEKEIAELRAENEKLREALKPFAYNYQDNGLSHSMFIFEMKDLLAAKKALESGDENS